MLLQLYNIDPDPVNRLPLLFTLVGIYLFYRWIKSLPDKKTTQSKSQVSAEAKQFELSQQVKVQIANLISTSTDTITESDEAKRKAESIAAATVRANQILNVAKAKGVAIDEEDENEEEVEEKLPPAPTPSTKTATDSENDRKKAESFAIATAKAAALAGATPKQESVKQNEPSKSKRVEEAESGASNALFDVMAEFDRDRSSDKPKINTEDLLMEASALASANQHEDVLKLVENTLVMIASGELIDDGNDNLVSFLFNAKGESLMALKKFGGAYKSFGYAIAKFKNVNSNNKNILRKIHSRRSIVEMVALFFPAEEKSSDVQQNNTFKAGDEISLRYQIYM